MLTGPCDDVQRERRERQADQVVARAVVDGRGQIGGEL